MAMRRRIKLEDRVSLTLHATADETAKAGREAEFSRRDRF
jgi:hypothetical protein